MKKAVKKAMAYKELRPRLVEEDPTSLSKYAGWYVSEKIDGWQGLWDGYRGKLVSKTGKKVFNLPESWMRVLSKLPPSLRLTGEMKIKNKQATSVAKLASKTHDDKAWKSTRFFIFDVPSYKEPFKTRYRKLVRVGEKLCKEWSKSNKGSCPFKVLKQRTFKSGTPIYKMYKRVLKKGGEGLVITSPDSLYDDSGKRVSTRVKLKGRNDTEGKVLGVRLGYEKHPDWMKSLTISIPGSKKTFQLAIGFSFDERKHYKKLFKKGTLVSYSYRELGSDKRPKEARFVRIRRDM